MYIGPVVSAQCQMCHHKYYLVQRSPHPNTQVMGNQSQLSKSGAHENVAINHIFMNVQMCECVCGTYVAYTTLFHLYRHEGLYNR